MYLHLELRIHLMHGTTVLGRIVILIVAIAGLLLAVVILAIPRLLRVIRIRCSRQLLLLLRVVRLGCERLRLRWRWRQP